MKKPRSKTLVTGIILTLVVVGLALYYIAAVSSDDRPGTERRASVLIVNLALGR